MSFGKRLKKARTDNNLTQKQLGELIGARHNSVSNWENDQNKPDATTIEILCRVLSISPSYLIGGDYFNDFDNVEPIPRQNTKKLPVLGEIACGEPIFCNQEYDDYIEADENIKADFALRAKGDSMVNARILDGDIVFIKTQPQVENGEIAAVIIDNDATLKRVYISGDTVTLVAENPRYAPIVYNTKKNDDIRILGKAVAFYSNL